MLPSVAPEAGQEQAASAPEATGSHDRGPRRLARPLRRMLARPIEVWRRSLQLRVVVATLVLSTIVTAFVGWMLLRQVQDGLVEDKVATSLSEASAGIQAAREQIAASESTGDVGQLLTQLTQDIARRGASAGTYDVVVEHGSADDRTVGGARAPRASGNVLPVSVPGDLRERFPTDRVLWQYTQIRWRDGSREPGIAVGAQVHGASAGGTHQVYYLFPFTHEIETLRLVQRALLAAGSALVLLLGAVAWLVAHQVVNPVRAARKIAERFSAGRLEERMRVKGRDDLARLASSFNHMAANLQRQIGQLEELSRVQRRFVSDVSHELRTPLTTVRMASDVLHEARGEFDPNTARAAELLYTELGRFEALLSDLLEISRHDAGAASLTVESVDVTELVQRVVDQTRVLAASKGSQIHVGTPSEECTADIDARRIERVVRNLVGNAIEYGEGNDVEVGVVGDDEAVAISVRDHGVGLKPGEAALVFDRFWRADPARARTTGGTGLGLAIALEDTMLHGGWLQAWGEPGNGAHFRLTLPRAGGARLQHSPVPLVPADAQVARPAGSSGADVAANVSAGNGAGPTDSSMVEA